MNCGEAGGGGDTDDVTTDKFLANIRFFRFYTNSVDTGRKKNQFTISIL